MNDITLAIILVAAIGLLSGVLLSVASIVMAVPKNQKQEDIRAMLPGANCGACGFSGCDGYAAALASGEAKPGLCTVGGAKTLKEIAAYLGVEAEGMERRAATVRCLGSDDNTSNRASYEGIMTCAAAALASGGPAACRYGCIGMGDCAAVCEYGAISVRNGVAMVETEKCVACGKCVKACPKGLISIAPVKKQAIVLCSNCGKGAVTMKVCKAGCIGCMRCEKACESDAVHVTDFLARVDPEKCTACGKCVSVCPRHVIVMKG